VIDRDTSELVERSTYQGYGAAESDYRPERWKSFREDYRFTGKEEDIEVGLQYFGKRYYAPQLGRWASADPLSIHRFGGDANLYAYVRGALLRAIDRMGLDGEFDAMGTPLDEPKGLQKAALASLITPVVIGCIMAPAACARVGTWAGRAVVGGGLATLALKGESETRTNQILLDWAGAEIGVRVIGAGAGAQALSDAQLPARRGEQRGPPVSMARRPRLGLSTAPTPAEW
jgi:RHS repeat-associated protein